eukprot:g216.t1
MGVPDALSQAIAATKRCQESSLTVNKSPLPMTADQNQLTTSMTGNHSSGLFRQLEQNYLSPAKRRQLSTNVQITSGSQYITCSQYSGTCQTKNYPNEYGNRERANIRLTGPGILYFSAFDVENHDLCSYDYLKIGSDKRCGSTIPPIVNVAAGSTMTLEWYTDGGVLRTGWKFTFSSCSFSCPSGKTCVDIVEAENTNACSGSNTKITSSTECQNAANRLGYTWKGDETVSDYPSGCYRYGSSSVYYNKHSTGSARSYNYPICRGCGSCPQVSYLCANTKSVGSESSLRSAVTAANNRGPSSYVEVTGNIQFTGAMQDDSALFIDAATIAIVGQGGMKELKGQGQSGNYRIFYMKDFANVHLENLKIMDGY